MTSQGKARLALAQFADRSDIALKNL